MWLNHKNFLFTKKVKNRQLHHNNFQVNALTLGGNYSCLDVALPVKVGIKAF